MAHQSINIQGISYLIVGRNDMRNYPNTRRRMDECGIRGYVSLRRPRGYVIYQAIEYVSGKIKL